jgi:geranylgeranylglycerol-phosphate geranylgeranyltransferase
MSSLDTRIFIGVSSPDGWLALVRWRNALLSAAGVLAGAWWSAGRVTLDVVLVMLAAMALTAVANTTNDLADIEIDRVAHPRRPLPSGAISTKAAGRFAIACSIVAVVVIAMVDWLLAVLTLAVLAVMWTYSASFKRHGLPGNTAVAVLASLPFVYGAWVVEEIGKGVLLLMVAAPLHFAREVAKDVDDAAADAGTRRTLPLRRGIASARLLVGAGVATYTVAVALLGFAHPLFAILLVPTIFLAGLAVRRVYRDRDGAPALLKAAMALAIAALLISRR